MHNEARAFIRGAVKGRENGAVLEIGSRNINGEVRDLFTGEYRGIDRAPGSGVDLVIEARDYNGEGYFDLVVSAEALEHAQNPNDIILCASRALKPGGLFVLTCAGPDRPPHGCMGGPVFPGEYYRGVTIDWLADCLNNNGFKMHAFDYHADRGDLYGVAVKE